MGFLFNTVILCFTNSLYDDNYNEGIVTKCALAIDVMLYCETFFWFFGMKQKYITLKKLNSKFYNHKSIYLYLGIYYM